jgi:bile acid:Na+ symporter, BASS family
MTFEQVLQALLNPVIATFIVDSTFALGLLLTVRQVVTPLTDVAATLKALVANFVLAPATAYVLVRGFHLQQDVAIAFILLGCSAGDPLCPKLTQFAGGDRAYSLAVMVLLSVISLVYLPIVVPLLLPGVDVNPVQLAKPLVVLILSPLLLGFAIKRWLPQLAERLAPPLDRLASYLVAALVINVVLVNYRGFIALFGSRAILSSILLLVLAAAYGYMLGGPTRIHKNDLALNTGYRGISAAVAIAITHFPASPTCSLSGYSRP